MQPKSSSFAALLIAVVTACVFSLIITGCSDAGREDKVVTVEDDDAEMNAAIAQARSSLPQFWQTFEKPANGETDFALKVRITDANGTEHFWATEVERRGGIIKGTIGNDPDTVKSVKLGERIVIPEADISDWLYMRNGKMVGNATVKPLLKQMPPVEVERLKNLMADP